MQFNSAFDAFHNCSMTVSRAEGERTAVGFEESGTTTVLKCRADAQESGRDLERLQQLHETGDALVFASQAISGIEPGDQVTLNMDDGRTLEGSVEDASPVDDSILVGL